MSLYNHLDIIVTNNQFRNCLPGARPVTIIHHENRNNVTANSANSAVQCVAASEIDGNVYVLSVLPICQQAHR